MGRQLRLSQVAPTTLVFAMTLLMIVQSYRIKMVTTVTKVKLVVGTTSGTSISFGTAVIFEAGIRFRKLLLFLIRVRTELVNSLPFTVVLVVIHCCGRSFWDKHYSRWHSADYMVSLVLYYYGVLLLMLTPEKQLYLTNTRKWDTAALSISFR
jgi:hypothetical protein